MRSRAALDPLVSFATAWGLLAMPAMLDTIGHDLGIGLALAGQTSTASGLALALGGPIALWLARGIDNDRLLRAALACFALFQALSALAPGFEALMLCRFLAGLCASLVFPCIASRTATMTAEQRVQRLGRLSIAFTLAAVAGMPLVALSLPAQGWRVSLTATSLLPMLALLMSARLPAQGGALTTGLGLVRRQMLAVLTQAWPLLLVTLLQSTAQMAVFTYLEGLVRHYDGARQPGMGAVYFCFGMAGILGNALLPRLVSRLGPVNCALLLLATMALAFTLWRLAAPQQALLLAPVLLWGLIGAAIGVCQQTRLLGTAPQAARILSASHSSSIYLGQALGAAAGGWVIQQRGMPALLELATAVLIAALLLTLLRSPDRSLAAAAGTRS